MQRINERIRRLEIQSQSGGGTTVRFVTNYACRDKGRQSETIIREYQLTTNQRTGQ